MGILKSCASSTKLYLVTPGISPPTAGSSPVSNPAHTHTHAIPPAHPHRSDAGIRRSSGLRRPIGWMAADGVPMTRGSQRIALPRSSAASAGRRADRRPKGRGGSSGGLCGGCRPGRMEPAPATAGHSRCLDVGHLAASQGINAFPVVFQEQFQEILEELLALEVFS